MLTFDRNQVHLVDEVRRMRHQAGTGSTNWREIGRRLARQRGIFTVWRCDDTMVVYTRDGDKVRQQSFGPKTWRFAA